MRTRVVVTGIGLVTPLGLSTHKTWSNIITGQTAIRPTHHHKSLPIFPTASIPRDTLPTPPPLLSACPPFASFALLAARGALLDARLLHSGIDDPNYINTRLDNDPTSPYNPDMSGVSIGVGMAHIPDIASICTLLENNSYRKVSPYSVPRILPNTPSGLVSLLHSLRGPILAPSTACAAGAHAICDGLHAIQRGDANLMVVGGTEAAIHPVTMAGFGRAKALTLNPNGSAPFDTNRSGFVLGEGAAILILESLEHALHRNAPGAYAELCGCGMTGDAYHITSPSPDGTGAVRAMRSALRSARCNAEDIDYINAHATGTIVGDNVERKAIAKLLPRQENRHDKMAVASSTKGSTGHLLGAAGAVEAAFTVLSIAESVIPPTVGLKQLDDIDEVTECGWGDIQRYVPEEAIRRDVSLALSNSFGFGGTNVSLAFGRPPDDIERRGIRISG